VNIEDFRTYCLNKPGVTESLPFDSETLVFKVGGKMFALTDIEHFNSVNLKCDPEKAVLLREHYSGVKPGYHMNKVHWNTVSCDGSISDQLILEWTDDSYQLVVASLPGKIKKELNLT
jgi:predicted DNA-binding protein (MmcQ/YjbR family)